MRRVVANMTDTEPTNAATRFVLPETTLLAMIGCLDLFATIYLIATHKGSEANPLMAGILQNLGPFGFVLFKALLLGGPLAIAELARRQHPRFVQNALRVGIVLYVGLLVVAYWRHSLMFYFGG